MKNLKTISSLKMILATAALTFLITGCGENDPENKGNHLPDVKILQNDKTVKVGTTVKLISTALDVDGDALTYKWSFSSKPTGSTATLTVSKKKETTFTVDKVGKYVVKFVATDTLDAEGSDTVTITVIDKACTSYTEISEDISADKTLDGCYKITRDVLGISADIVLTIKPGSTLMFLEGGGINVDGALNAVGTAEKPILFTAQQKTAGYWGAIKFRGSNDTRNAIAHATIEYGGKGDDASLRAVGNHGADNRLKLSNITIKHSASDGFELEKRTKLDKFENITSTKNAKTAGVVDMSVLEKLDATSDFTGNLGNDYIVVKEGDIEQSATWKKLTVPVNIQRDIHLADNADLTLEAGVELVFNDGTKLSTGPLGSLKAVGTKSEPIIFTGTQKTAGAWIGIIIGSNSTDNILQNTVVEYAGSDGSALTLYTHFSASSGARVSVTASTFRNNSGYAIAMDDKEDSTYNKDIESSNNFINNADGTINYDD